MKEYTIEECDLDLLKDHISNYILKNNKKYVIQGFTIYLGEYFLKIKYHHHIYKTTIIKVGKEGYWYLRPFKKSYFTTNASSKSSFELVIYAIKENDLKH
jgi:hypothetical protein